MTYPDTNDPLIITDQGFLGYCALMHDLDRYRHRVARREVSLAKEDYREINPAFTKTSGGNEGGSAAVAQ